jgi:hypothetical protein
MMKKREQKQRSRSQKAPFLICAAEKLSELRGIY